MSTADVTPAASPIPSSAVTHAPHRKPIRGASNARSTSPSSPTNWLPANETSVATISEIPDVAVRNLWITQTYFDLSRRLGDVIASDHTWCTFAVWASSTAGQSIREEELGETVKALLHDRTDHHRAVAEANQATRWLRRLGIMRLIDITHVEALLRRSVDVVRDRIAHGNTLVFSELAPLFVRLLDEVESGRTAAEDDEDLVLRRIGLEPDDDDLVVRAFRLYLRAVHEPYSTSRSQRVLAANIWAVLHEQQRLQTDVAESMDSGFIVLDEMVASHLHRWLPDAVSDRIVRRVLHRLEAPIRALFEDLATALMMELHTPGEVLHLGDTLPPLPSGQLFPPALADIELPTLVDALGEWDGTGGTGRDCGARDWSVLHERMTYIVNLFRSRQQTTVLAQAPFSETQLATMRELRQPSGSLLAG